jgi:AraC-like DNA-binding protein
MSRRIPDLSPPRGQDLALLDAPLIRLWGGGPRRDTAPLGWHRNDGFEVTLLLEGGVRWEIEKGPALTLSGGDVSLMLPRIRHRGEHDVIAPSYLLWMVFDPRRPGAGRNTPFSAADLERMEREFRRAGNIVFRAPESLLTVSRLWAARQEGFAVEDPVSRAGMRAVLGLFLWTLLETIAAPGAPRRTGEIRRAEAYILEHLAEPIGVGDVARFTGLSVSRFHERFRRELGVTPADFIQRSRCARARERLRASGLPVTEIAFACGFSSSQYFAKTFRKYTGCTPTAYRRRAGGGNAVEFACRRRLSL